MPVAPITSARLELVSMSPRVLESLLGDRPGEAASELGVAPPAGWAADHAGFLRLRLEQMRRDPSTQEWLARAAVLRGGAPSFVGFAGFHGPPGVNALGRADAVELGYSVEPAHRRRGYATEVVEALVGWAAGEHGIAAFVASVAPDNEPSLALVRKLGFRQVGEHWDEEDGLELEFLLERPLGWSTRERA